MLEVRDLSVAYGPIVAARDVTLSVRSGEIVCLVGSNGAGKSSILKGIMGLERSTGQVSLAETPLTGLSSSRRTELGLVLVPEGRHIFGGMTVVENLQIGGRHLSPPDARNSIEEVYELFPRLAERRDQAGGTLSGGEQQMLAIGRAMMSHPACILLDEPTLGLAPIAVRQVGEVLRLLKGRGVALLLSEQNLIFALGVADRGYVMETGALVHEGTASDLQNDSRVREAYLGAA